jgi:hypothetical protein
VGVFFVFLAGFKHGGAVGVWTTKFRNPTASQGENETWAKGGGAAETSSVNGNKRDWKSNVSAMP